ncbi:MAG: alpha-methylacyl-CoA racemase [Alphaproteobacteria bacterium]|nr:MAG: alpha-methylacyl-CoA racemase [Alphaproteobacteria bacterium]
MAGGPLNGLKVVEMAGIGPCPLAGQLLADLGAEVVAIGRRGANPLGGAVNGRGKRALAVDLKHDDGLQVVKGLVARADVLIEGFRPGVMERLGLGPDALLAANPALVYGRVTGWGQDGPLAQAAGHDINYLSLTGLLNAIGDPDRPPVPPLNLAADYAGGTMFLIAGVLAALFERSRSGRGQVVDAAMVDGVGALLGLIHSFRATGAWTNERGANLLDGGAPFYRCYRTADGRFVSVGALEPQFFAALAERLGLDGRWLGERMDRTKWPQLAAELAAAFAARTRDEWAAVFEGTDCCVAPVLDWDEAPRHPHMAARRAFFTADGTTQAAPAPRFSRTPADLPHRCAPGEADALLGELGYDAAQIERLREAGAIS